MPKPLMTRPSHEDPTPVSLNGDEAARLRKCISDAQGALSGLGDTQFIKTVGQAHMLVSLLEYHTKDIGSIFKYEEQLAREFKERYEDIQRANAYIRELEEKLGNTQPLDALQGLIKQAQEIVQSWWRSNGFGYILKWEINPHVFGCTLRPSFNSIGVNDSKEPVTRKKTLVDCIRHHEENGLKVLPGHNPSHPDTDRDVLDCDSNKQYISNLLLKRFPGSNISRWESTTHLYKEGNKEYEIREFQVFIPYESIILPVKEEI